VHQEFRHVRQPVDEGPLLLPLRGEAPHALLEPFRNVEITVGSDREAERSLELAARRFRGDVEGKNAAGAGGFRKGSPSSAWPRYSPA
jgi:hypothetical protein